MKKVVSYTCVISLVFCFIHAEETPTMKESTMQTAVEPSRTDQEATKALKKLEDEKEKDEKVATCPIKIADSGHEEPDEDDMDDDDDDYDFDDEEDDEEDWDDDDYEDEDEDED